MYFFIVDDVRYKVSKNITVIPSLWLMLRDVVWEDLAISSTLLESPIFKKSIQSSQQVESKMRIDWIWFWGIYFYMSNIIIEVQYCKGSCIMLLFGNSISKGTQSIGLKNHPLFSRRTELFWSKLSILFHWHHCKLFTFSSPE